MSLTSIIIAVVGSLLELNHHQSSSATSCPGSTPITAPFQHPQPRGQEHNSRSLYSVSQSTQSSIKLPTQSLPARPFHSLITLMCQHSVAAKWQPSLCSPVYKVMCTSVTDKHGRAG
ncbi:transcription factor MafF [Biomphalaria glabrata]|nr:transcription factor MafF-like [Biomphalaria glabrata]